MSPSTLQFIPPYLVPNEDEEDVADYDAGLLDDPEHENVEGNKLDGEVHAVRRHAHSEPRKEEELWGITKPRSHYFAQYKQTDLPGRAV